MSLEAGMKRLVLVGAFVGVFAASSAYAQAQGSNTVLGTVHIAKKVIADGKPLAAGTYQVRLTNDAPKPGVGQAPDAEKYVEFLRGGKVVAREVATVIPKDEISKVAKGKTPAAGSARVEMLKGGDYYRVWINRAGTNYLINLPTGA
ncbi:MAG TPA: hypothetical protein VKJ07_25270 [Mycobacteriales bacterium]|nr:hypothetical protein [Mycobacteriales bacterium]